MFGRFNPPCLPVNPHKTSQKISKTYQTMVLLVTPTICVPHLSIIAPFTAQERGRLIFRTLAFRGGERNVVLSVKFDGEDREFFPWKKLWKTMGKGAIQR